MTEQTSVKDELAAMGKIVRILDNLDRTAADRIVNWMFDRFSGDPAASDTPDTPA